MPQTLPNSPSLAALQEQLSRGRDGELDSFWNRVTRQGTPLVELHQDNPHQLLVTFLFRAGPQVSQVDVVSNLTGGMGVSDPMTCLPGTDLWYKTYALPSDTRESYQFAVRGIHIPDPLNPRAHVFPSDEANGVVGWTSSVVELPDAPPQPWAAPRVGVPAGRVVLHSVHSDILANDYRTWIYTPPDYSLANGPYPFLLVLDGWYFVHVVPTPVMLDNLIADGLLPPLMAILVGGVFDKTRRRDLACYPPYVDFLTGELLPWARQNYHLTNDPTQAIVAGGSLGGLGAAYVGFTHPDLFGNVLSQSPFFEWKPGGHDEGFWLPRQFAAAPQLPLRFHIDAGSFETRIDTAFGVRTDILAGARHMRDVLRAKGYPVHYAEFSGGHGPMNYPNTWPNGLLALLGHQRKN